MQNIIKCSNKFKSKISCIKGNSYKSIIENLNAVVDAYVSYFRNIIKNKKELFRKETEAIVVNIRNIDNEIKNKNIDIDFDELKKKIDFKDKLEKTENLISAARSGTFSLSKYEALRIYVDSLYL